MTTFEMKYWVRLTLSVLLPGVVLSSAVANDEKIGNLRTALEGGEKSSSRDRERFLEEYFAAEIDSDPAGLSGAFLSEMSTTTDVETFMFLRGIWNAIPVAEAQRATGALALLNSENDNEVVFGRELLEQRRQILNESVPEYFESVTGFDQPNDFPERLAQEMRYQSPFESASYFSRELEAEIDRANQLFNSYMLEPDHEKKGEIWQNLKPLLADFIANGEADLAAFVLVKSRKNRNEDVLSNLARDAIARRKQIEEGKSGLDGLEKYDPETFTPNAALTSPIRKTEDPQVEGEGVVPSAESQPPNEAVPNTSAQTGENHIWLWVVVLGLPTVLLFCFLMRRRK